MACPVHVCVSFFILGGTAAVPLQTGKQNDGRGLIRREDEVARRLRDRARGESVLDVFLKEQQEVFKNFTATVTKGRRFPLTRPSIQNAVHVSARDYRLQKAIQKLKSGEELRIVVVGGSVSAGAGCFEPSSRWPSQLNGFLDKLAAKFGAKVHVVNRAQAGSTCQWVLEHWKDYEKDLNEADIIIDEYHSNELYGLVENEENHYGRGRGFAGDSINTLFVQSVLTLPNKPAFIYLDMPCWWPGEQMMRSLEAMGNRERSLYMGGTVTKRCTSALGTPHGDSVHLRVATEFEVPLIWYPDAVSAEGSLYLDFPEPGAPDFPFEGKPHPRCLPAHYIMASLVHAVMLSELEHIEESGVVAHEHQIPPLQEDEKKRLFCVTNPTWEAYASMGEKAFKATSNEGWSFGEDVPGKPGWIAASGKQHEIAFDVKIGEQSIVSIEYLRSYGAFGTATCRLGSGEAVLHGTWDKKASVSHYVRLHTNYSTGVHSLRCMSDGLKFKITGIVTC